jgi:hypothetical protein
MNLQLQRNIDLDGAQELRKRGTALPPIRRVTDAGTDNVCDARYMTVGHPGWKAVGAPVKMNA